jgi:hypothetical protein
MVSCSVEKSNCFLTRRGKRDESIFLFLNSFQGEGDVFKSAHHLNQTAASSGDDAAV